MLKIRHSDTRVFIMPGNPLYKPLSGHVYPGTVECEINLPAISVSCDKGMKMKTRIGM